MKRGLLAMMLTMARSLGEPPAMQDVAAEMAEAAQRITAALSPEDQEAAMLDFDSDERENWSCVPRQRAGVAVADADFDAIRFGWAGGLDLGDAYDYRIHSPAFLIEPANVQNDANHIHTVWGDHANDFGRDLPGGRHRHHHRPENP